MPAQVLLTATGFAARKARAMLRKRKIATAPLLLELICWNTNLRWQRMKAMAFPNACRGLRRCRLWLAAAASGERRRRPFSGGRLYLEAMAKRSNALMLLGNNR